MSKLLLDSEPLIIIPELAVKIGLNESIILQQIHYWLEINRKVNRHFLDNHYWTYNTYVKWQQQFPFFSVSTIKRAIYNLEKLNLIITTNKYNELEIDKTKWYTINYEEVEKVEKLELLPIAQNGISGKKENFNDGSFCDIAKRNIQRTKMSKAIPEITSEINKEEEEAFQEVCNSYSFIKDNKISKYDRKILLELIKTHGGLITLEAIKAMAERAEKPNLKYLKSTLEDWKSKGLDTIEKIELHFAKEEVLKEDAKKNNHVKLERAAKGTCKVKQDSFNSYDQRPMTAEELEEIAKATRGNEEVEEIKNTPEWVKRMRNKNKEE